MYKCLYIVYCEWLNVVLCTVLFKEKRFFTPPESVRLYLCDLWITDTVTLDKIHREIYFCLILFTSRWMTVERFRLAGCIQTKTGGFTLIEHLLLTQWVFVYLLKRLTICNDVYNSHPRCEGSTVNISSTSDSVFEVCYEFCARFFLFVCLFYFLPNRRRFCTSPDKQRSKEYLCSYSLGFVLYLLS